MITTMASSSPAPLLLFLSFLVLFSPSTAANTKLFREYIGAQFKNVKFTDVPINPGVTFDFILSFAIDSTPSATPTNGNFNVFWDSANLSPAAVASIKSQHPNVRVAVSLGGDSVGGRPAVFRPTSVSSWVSNAVSSLTRIIRQYHLDGIDIDYEHFAADPNTFADCVGQLVVALKRNRVISFASIAPFDDADVQRHYQALWKKYGGVIDYVNFQFYAYSASTTVPQFLGYYNAQVANYPGGKVLVSTISDGSGGLTPANGFFTACRTLKSQGRLNGIFIWSADDSKAFGFKDEKQAQQLLAI